MTQRVGRRRCAGWALLALVTALSPARSASFSKAARGTTGAQLLELPTSARAAAMGSAQGAAVRDAAALNYNPAALASIEGGDAVFMHAEQFEGISFDSLAAARRFGDAGTLALGLRSLSPGKIEQIDNTGAVTGGSLAPRDMAVALGYGRAFGSLELGAAGKYISSKIEKTASAFAMDLGGRYRWGPAAVSLGASHLGQGQKFRERRYPLPTTVRLGSSYDWGRWIFALDAIAPTRTAPYPAVGAEYRRPVSQRVTIAGRAGYDGRLMQSRLGGLAGAAVGMGIQLGGARFDYALMPYGDLGVTHRLSLGLEWGARGPRETAQTPDRRSVSTTARDPLSRRFATADVLIQKGRFADAERTLDEIAQTLPGEDRNRIIYYEAKGRSRRLQGDCVTAESLYLAGLGLAAGSGLAAHGVADCYAGMGLCLIRRGQALDGAVYLRKALEANPSSETRATVEEEFSRIRAGGATNHRAGGFK